MWLSKIAVPESLDMYSIHQYLWATFSSADDMDRPFIFVIKDNYIVMLSTIRPSIDHTELDLSSISGCLPFSLVANPTKRDIKTRKIQAILDMNDRREWLRNKLVGCKLKYCNNTPKMERHSFRGKTIYTDTMDGIIEITDKDEFLRFLIHGVGRSKSFGCGFLFLPTVMKI